MRPARTSAAVFAPARPACARVIFSESASGTRLRRSFAPGARGSEHCTHQRAPRRSTVPAPFVAFFAIALRSFHVVAHSLQAAQFASHSTDATRLVLVALRFVAAMQCQPSGAPVA